MYSLTHFAADSIKCIEEFYDDSRIIIGQKKTAKALFPKVCKEDVVNAVDKMHELLYVSTGCKKSDKTPEDISEGCKLLPLYVFVKLIKAQQLPLNQEQLDLIDVYFDSVQGIGFSVDDFLDSVKNKNIARVRIIDIVGISKSYEGVFWVALFDAIRSSKCSEKSLAGFIDSLAIIASRFAILGELDCATASNIIDDLAKAIEWRLNKYQIHPSNKQPNRLNDTENAESDLPEPNTFREKIILSENIETLEKARELLVHHHRSKTIYLKDIHELVAMLDSYNHSSAAAAEVIKKLFPVPQMAYDKFMGDLMESDAAFLRLICKGANIIGISIRRSAKRDEILSKIKDDARSLAELCDDLATVLINKYGESNNDDEATKEIEILLADLQTLIESVKNYS